MDSAIGDLVPPKGRLMVQVGQGGEGSSCEEIRFDIADRFFDPSLLVGRSDIAGRRGKEVVGTEAEEAGIELDGGAHVVKDDAG